MYPGSAVLALKLQAKETTKFCILHFAFEESYEIDTDWS